MERLRQIGSIKPASAAEIGWSRLGVGFEKLDRKATVAEVKRNPRKFSAHTLEQKYQYIKSHLRGYQVELKGLSMEDM